MDADTSRDRTASQESFTPLLQLDPEPIDSPPILIDVDSPVDLGLAESQDGGGQDGIDTNSVTIKAPSAGAPGLSASAILGSTSTTAAGPGPIFYCSLPTIRCHVNRGYNFPTNPELLVNLSPNIVMRIQKFSSYAMGFFTSLHLANVSLIPAITRSVAGSENYLLMTREVYQTSLTEPILVALPVIAHVGSGITLRLLRRSQNLKKYGGAMPGTASPWPSLSYISMSGYAFTFFYAAHVFANRVLPLQVEGDSSNIGLAYVAHCFGRHPALSRVAYIGLLAVGCSHMIWGQAKWLGIAPSTKEVQRTRNVVMEKRKKYRRRSWAGLHGISAAFVALWAAGGLIVVARGGLTDGWVGKVYDDMFETIGL